MFRIRVLDDIAEPLAEEDGPIPALAGRVWSG